MLPFPRSIGKSMIEIGEDDSPPSWQEEKGDVAQHRDESAMDEARQDREKKANESKGEESHRETGSASRAG